MFTNVIPVLDRLKQCEDSEVPALVAAFRFEMGENLPSACLRFNGGPDPDGCYPFDVFLERLMLARGVMYGYQTAYMRASATSHHPASLDMLKLWRKNGRVPAKYVEQIGRLTFSGPIRCAPKRHWTYVEIEFLETLYLDNPRMPNKFLGERCTEKFGRLITEKAIIGQLDRSRKKSHVPAYRQKAMA